LDACRVTFRETKNGENGRVPFPDILYPILRAQVEKCPDGEAPVFDFRNFDQLWGEARIRAGLEDVHLHDLRRSYASHLVTATNGNLKVVQDLLRHNDFRSTLRYAHLADSTKREAVLTLDKTFGFGGNGGRDGTAAAPSEGNGGANEGARKVRSAEAGAPAAAPAPKGSSCQ
jgi:integrase